MKIVQRLFASMVSLLLIFIGQSSYAAQEPGISDSEILFGASYPKTGPLSPYYSSYFAGAQAYFDYLNSQGGIHGRKIKLVTFDDQGVVTKSIQGASQLILKDQVFALFSSNPTTAGHIAAATSLAIGRRGIPDLFPLVGWSGFKNSKKYPTTFVLNPSVEREARVIASFVKDYFPTRTLNAVVQNDDIGAAVQTTWSQIGFKVNDYRKVIAGFNFQLNPILDENSGAIVLTSRVPGFPERINTSIPVITRYDAVSVIQRLIELPEVKWANIYAGYYLPLPDEPNNEFVTFFNSIFSNSIAEENIDGRAIEGANAAYVLAQALAAVGPDVNRSKLIDFLRTNGSSLSHAGSAPLNFSNDADSNKSSIYFARFDGSSWSKFSDNYVTALNSNIVNKLNTTSSKLLPKGLPVIAKQPTSSMKSISCVNGKAVKTVTAIKPFCPKGYKIKK